MSRSGIFAMSSAWIDCREHSILSRAKSAAGCTALLPSRLGDSVCEANRGEFGRVASHEERSWRLHSALIYESAA